MPPLPPKSPSPITSPGGAEARLSRSPGIGTRRRLSGRKFRPGCGGRRQTAVGRRRDGRKRRPRHRLLIRRRSRRPNHLLRRAGKRQPDHEHHGRDHFDERPKSRHHGAGLDGDCCGSCKRAASLSQSPQHRYAAFAGDEPGDGAEIPPIWVGRRQGDRSGHEAAQGKESEFRLASTAESVYPAAALTDRAPPGKPGARCEGGAAMMIERFARGAVHGPR